MQAARHAQVTPVFQAQQQQQQQPQQASR